MPWDKRGGFQRSASIIWRRTSVLRGVCALVEALVEVAEHGVQVVARSSRGGEVFAQFVDLGVAPAPNDSSYVRSDLDDRSFQHTRDSHVAFQNTIGLSSPEH